MITQLCDLGINTNQYESYMKNETAHIHLRVLVFIISHILKNK